MPEITTEFKTVPQYVKSIDGRKVDGVFSVFGNKDSYNDIGHRGSFKKTIEERGGKVLHLWQHDFMKPPTAVVVKLFEIERADLPEIVQVKYPEATGGAVVSREYIESERANEVIALIKAGAPLEMSYGYDAIRYEYEETEEDGVVRHLLEQRLWETSDVLWGANDATTVTKNRPSIPLDALLGQIDNWLSALKEGRRNASGDLGRINTIATLAYELGATSVKLVEDEDEEESEDEGEKTPLELMIETAVASALSTNEEDGREPVIVVVNVPDSSKLEGEDETPDANTDELDGEKTSDLDEENEDETPEDGKTAVEEEDEEESEEIEDKADEESAEPLGDDQALTLLFSQVDLLELEI